MHILYIIEKELRCIKENLSFNLVTILSPLLFLFTFTVMLSGGIKLPVQVYPDIQSSPFLQTLSDYKAPDGTAYFELQPANSAIPPSNSESNLLVVQTEPVLKNGEFYGQIFHYINDVNANMTKNYRNRLDGALVEYINSARAGGNIDVTEYTMYDKDIPWDTGFGVSVFVFGLVLAGLLFGMLSMTSEWENKTTKLLKLSPNSAATTIVGKTLACIIKCFASGIAFLIIFFFISKAIPVHALLLTIILFLIYGIFTSIGMFLGIYIKSTLTAFLISLVSALTLWVGGGGFGPLSYFGEITNVLGNMNPVTYALELIRWCYFEGSTNVSFGLGFLLIMFFVVLSLIIVIYTRWIRSEEVM